MTEGRMTWQHGETWYRVIGDLSDPSTVPAVVLHGGPGACHNYVIPIAELLAERGRACVLYDQIGCGNSTHLPDAPADFWTVQLFKDELQLLLEHLGIANRYELVGQSWGGMLAMDWALDPRPGLVALGICDSPASMNLWVEEANRLRSELPDEVNATLLRHEEAGTTDSVEYVAATQFFYNRHVCRVVPNPQCLLDSNMAMDADPTVYHTMNGPSEFYCIGSLREWDITDQLHQISVPTLLVSGRFDEATPLIVGTIHERIAGSEWVIFEESSHTPHIEEPQRFQQVVADWLAAFD